MSSISKLNPASASYKYNLLAMRLYKRETQKYIKHKGHYWLIAETQCIKVYIKPKMHWKRTKEFQNGIYVREQVPIPIRIQH